MNQRKLTQTPKEDLVDTIAGILKTGIDLDFLLELREKELENLITCFRDWTQREENG